jgi:hypothetical protein
MNEGARRGGADGVGAAEEESGEAEREDGMAEAGAEVLPEGAATRQERVERLEI